MFVFVFVFVFVSGAGVSRGASSMREVEARALPVVKASTPKAMDWWLVVTRPERMS